MNTPRNWVARLRSFARPPAEPDRCALCGTPLPERHAHLVEPQAHRMLCACTACAVLFEYRVGTRFKRVPDRGVALGDGAFSDEDWAALKVPVDIAFFFDSSADDRVVGFYPGAAGAVEAPIDEAVWRHIKAATPALHDLAPDVEALLVDRRRGARASYRVPIDRCYLLAGLIRRHWRGFSGGSEVKLRIERFFDELRRDCREEAVA